MNFTPSSGKPPVDLGPAQGSDAFGLGMMRAHPLPAHIDDPGDKYIFADFGGAAVRIGSRSGQDWEPVQLHARASVELRAAWQAIDALVDVVAKLKGGEAARAAVEAIKVELGTITGGDAAHKLEARKR